MHKFEVSKTFEVLTKNYSKYSNLGNIITI